MCKKVVNESTFTFEFVPDIKRMKRKILLRSNRYATQEINKNFVDAYILTLELVLEWFVKSKMLKNL